MSEIIQNIKNTREALKEEIALIKKDEKYKMFPEQIELVGCAEMIVYMNDDIFLLKNSEKELKNINIMLERATELLSFASKG